MRSSDWDAKFAASPALFTDRPNATVVAEVAGLRHGAALDLAAGQGRNAVWLAERGWTVTAVDFSPVGLGNAETLAADRGVRLDTVLADVTAWRPPPGGFDLVVVAYLHLPREQLASVLAAAGRAVAPGGTFLLVGHDRDNIAHGYGGPQIPDVLYTVDEVCAALDGLALTRAEQVRRMVDTEIGPLAAIDTVVVGTAPARSVT